MSFFDLTLTDVLSTYKEVELAETNAELEAKKAAYAAGVRPEAITDERQENQRDIAGNEEQKAAQSYLKPVLIGVGSLLLVVGLVAFVRSK